MTTELELHEIQRLLDSLRISGETETGCVTSSESLVAVPLAGCSPIGVTEQDSQRAEMIDRVLRAGDR